VAYCHPVSDVGFCARSLVGFQPESALLAAVRTRDTMTAGRGNCPFAGSPFPWGPVASVSAGLPELVGYVSWFCTVVVVLSSMAPLGCGLAHEKTAELGLAR